jgi:hypothetical protein
VTPDAILQAMRQLTQEIDTALVGPEPNYILARDAAATLHELARRLTEPREHPIRQLIDEINHINYRSDQ